MVLLSDLGAGRGVTSESRWLAIISAGQNHTGHQRTGLQCLGRVSRETSRCGLTAACCPFQLFDLARFRVLSENRLMMWPVLTGKL